MLHGIPPPGLERLLGWLTDPHRRNTRRSSREATASQGTIAPRPPAQNRELWTLTSDRASPTGQARNRQGSGTTRADDRITLRDQRWSAADAQDPPFWRMLSRSEEHTSELQSRPHLVCRL